jgi:hypothetical protein
MGKSLALSLAVPILTLVLVIMEQLGALDWWLGLNQVRRVARNLSLSVASVQRQFTPSDREWGPTLRLIRYYTKSSLPAGKEPNAIVRGQAVLGGAQALPGGAIAEWTAPSTPMFLVYGAGKVVAKGDHGIFVGGIGDLSIWIEQDLNWWKFLLNSVLVGLLSIGLVLLAWIQASAKNQYPAAP